MTVAPPRPPCFHAVMTQDGNQGGDPEKDGKGKDRAKTWRHPHVRNTLFLRADYRAQRFDRHFHDEFAIGIIDGGCQAFAYDRGRRLDMPAGTVALIAPGTVHSGWPGREGGWRYRMLYPAADLVAAAVADVFGTATPATFACPAVEDERLYRLLARFHAVSEDPSTDALEVESYGLAVIRDAFARHAGHRTPAAAPPHQPALRRIRDLIETRWDGTVTLDELSDLAGLGKFQLLRQFKAVYGLPPHAYRLQLRVQRARDLILAGNPLADTAAAAGFADQAHMTRAFRRTLGVTPGVLARS